MALTPGTRLGPYEVLAAIGEGGMGQVYRARDTKLNRDVAIKVLSDSVIGDPDRVARFQREAQVLASLNHPNIAHLYGFEETPAPRVSSWSWSRVPTLAERIARAAPTPARRSPLNRAGRSPRRSKPRTRRHHPPRPEAGQRQGQGRRHGEGAGFRPGQSAVTGTGAGSTAGRSNSPTLTARATQLGVILGTAAYMAPGAGQGQGASIGAPISGRLAS